MTHLKLTNVFAAAMVTLFAPAPFRLALPLGKPNA